MSDQAGVVGERDHPRIWNLVQLRSDGAPRPHLLADTGLLGFFRYRFFAYPGAAGVGVTTSAGDLDGDGRVKIVTSPVASVPVIRAFTGGGSKINEFFGFGALVSDADASVAVDDLNRDGKAEIVVGGNVGGADLVRAYTPAGTSPIELPLASRRSLPPPRPPAPRVAVADFTGDGTGDLLDTAGTTLRGFVGPNLFPFPATAQFPDALGGAYVG